MERMRVPGGAKGIMTGREGIQGTKEGDKRGTRRGCGMEQREIYGGKDTQGGAEKIK